MRYTYVGMCTIVESHSHNTYAARIARVIYDVRHALLTSVSDNFQTMGAIG